MLVMWDSGGAGAAKRSALRDADGNRELGSAEHLERAVMRKGFSVLSWQGRHTSVEKTLFLKKTLGQMLSQNTFHNHLIIQSNILIMLLSSW